MICKQAAHLSLLKKRNDALKITRKFGSTCPQQVDVILSGESDAVYNFLHVIRKTFYWRVISLGFIYMKNFFDKQQKIY